MGGKRGDLGRILRVPGQEEALVATIPGSQFSVGAVTTMTVVRTPTGHRASPIHRDINPEVLIGSGAKAPADRRGVPRSSPSGLSLDLVAGAFAVTDNGSGSHNAALSGGPDTITFYGNFDSVGGGGNDTIGVTGRQGDAVTAGGNVVNVTNSFDVITGGSGGDAIHRPGRFRHDQRRQRGGFDFGDRHVRPDQDGHRQR